MRKETAKGREKYDMRNVALSQLGYRSYTEYLQSDDWKAIRTEVLSKSPLCLCCEKEAQVVHHVRYDSATLLGLRHHVLATLCHACHESIEIQDGEKVALGQANNQLFYKARKTPTGAAWIKHYLATLGEERDSGKFRLYSRDMKAVGRELKTRLQEKLV